MPPTLPLLIVSQFERAVNLQSTSPYHLKQNHQHTHHEDRRFSCPLGLFGFSFFVLCLYQEDYCSHSRLDVFSRYHPWSFGTGGDL